MEQIIEIKRKQFTVLEDINEHSRKVSRKGKTFLFRSFKNDDEFETYIDNSNKLKNNGIHVPKLYVYDKKTLVLVEEFIEGKNVFNILLEKPLPEDILDQAFYMNWFMKSGRFCIDFTPDNFIYSNNGILYYIGIEKMFSFDESKTLEKKPIFLWFYGRDFVELLKQRGIAIDRDRFNPDDSAQQAALNKEIALAVVKFYR